MIYKNVIIPHSDALDLLQFKEMDYFAVENYSIPIELMMENAGLLLAKLVAQSAKNTKSQILIGVGNGNNGGGGLVAARRLAAWGYSVHLELITPITKELPLRQLNRALKFGVINESIENADVWVDAYLGFSQRLPLNEKLMERVLKANSSSCIKISLDIPTGFLGVTNIPFFRAHKVLTLAATKKILYDLPNSTEIYLADLGIPLNVYKKFGIDMPPFQLGSILKINQ